MRGGVLTVACTALAAAGHAGAGGTLPSMPVLLGVGCLLGAAFVILADRQRGLRQIALGAVGSQVLFHTAFSVAAPTHHGAPMGHSEPDAWSGVVAGLPDTRMLFAHLIASGVLAVLAARGETLLWALIRLFGITRVPALTLVPAAAPAAPAVPESRAEPRLRVESEIHPLRGPPYVEQVVPSQPTSALE